MTFPHASLLVQGIGSLFLVLVCFTLYATRRRPHFLLWVLSWSSFTVWLVLGGLARHGRAAGADAPAWLEGAAAAFGVWHAALWSLGLVWLLRSPSRPGATPLPDAAPLPEVGGPQPEPDCGWRAVTPGVAAALGVLGGLAFVAGTLLPVAATTTALSAAFALTYALSSWLCLRLHRRGAAPGLLLLGAVLVCAAIQQIHRAALGAYPWRAGPFADDGGLAGLMEFVLTTFTAVALIVMFFQQEQAQLRDALARLAESEGHLKLMFEHSGAGIAVLSPEGRFLRANPALGRFLGYDGKELAGRRLVDLADPDDCRHGASVSERAHGLAGDLHERERRYRHKDGRTVWARVLRVPVRDAAGAMRYIVAVLVDITDKRRAEEALAESELRYRLRFQGAFDGLHVCAETGEFLDANPAFCRMLGCDLAQLQQRTIADLADDLPLLRKHFAQALENGGDRCETRLRRADGGLVAVEVSTAIIHTEGRRLVHCVSRDISERKRAEEALRQAEEVLRDERDFSDQVLQTADALIVVLDEGGRIVRFNGKCAAVSGYAEEEVLGRVAWDFLIPERWAGPVREVFDRLLGGAQVPLLFENPWRTRQGEERLIAWRNAVVRNGGGRLRYVIATGLDITGQRQLEEQLRHAQKMETLGTLVGGIAHDFNNQLAVILGNLDLVLVELAPGDRGRRELLDAERAGRRCAEMTQGLLTFSRRRTVQPRALDVGAVLAEATRLLPRVLPATIRIQVEARPGLWPVLADVTQLHQVVMNLAVNARDAMPQGGALTLSAGNRVIGEADCARQVEARPGRYVVLAVSDTGVGMAPEVQRRIFEPFFTTKPVGQGTGLGLAMVYGIVKAAGGWINVASQPDSGTTFEVYLPAGEPAAEAPELTWPALRGGGERILVVDDERLVRELAVNVLERWGFKALTAGDGEAALAVYQKHGAEIDLVLLDYMMPGLTGLQVLERLKEINPEVRAVFASGHVLDSERERMEAAGARGFVAKPYRAEELVRLLRQTLDDGAPPVVPSCWAAGVAAG
jgi:PAS domain S-box-containing protein